MWLEQLRSALGAACSRRNRLPEAEKAFWENLPSKPSEEADGEEEPDKPLALEQAVHLKDEGNEKFARGGDVSDAMQCWLNALDALCEPPRQPEGEEPPPVKPPSLDDPKVLELRATLLLNLALGHKRLKQWRQAVSMCEEALLDQPGSVKALYRKADALGELCEWKEAEEAAAKLEETGEEGRKLAAQKREEWRRRRKAADGRQKKMWSAALAEKSEGPAKKENGKAPERKGAEAVEAWTAPKVEPMSIFDLRRKGLEWVEAEDFDDKIWKDGLGVREAAFYQRRALPLSLLAAASLAEVDFKAELVVHLLLDGNMAPFNEPHDWSLVLHRCPSVRSLTVVYVDIGAVGEDPAAGAPPMPYGTLLRPTEEGRVGDRVARAARFLGTYREFKEHCVDLPGLVVPQLALWADVPLYGFSEEDFGTRLEAFSLLEAAGVPSVVTQGGEIQMSGGPPIAMRVDEQASLSMAILGVGLGVAMTGGWCWNRFVVPLDRGKHGVLAAHALLGTMRPNGKRTVPLQAAAIKDALLRHGVEPAPYRIHERPRNDDLDRLRKQQWEAFLQKLRAQGRPVGPEADEQERQRQSMEFYQFCGMAEPPLC